MQWFVCIVNTQYGTMSRMMIKHHYVYILLQCSLNIWYAKLWIKHSNSIWNVLCPHRNYSSGEKQKFKQGRDSRELSLVAYLLRPPESVLIKANWCLDSSLWEANTVAGRSKHYMLPNWRNRSICTDGNHSFTIICREARQLLMWMMLVK